LRLFLLLTLLTVSTSQLFAYKDAFYFGLSKGYSEGVSENHKITDARKEYAVSSEFSALRFGPDFNFDRRHQLKGRWEFSIDERAYTYTAKDRTEYEEKGNRFGVAFLWGANIDFLLNDEFVPFFKLGYGLSNTTKIDNAYDGVYGVGFYFVTRYFEIGAGVDMEHRDFGGPRFDYEIFKNSAESFSTSYINLNFRFY